ncbi:MAG: hypothetical protein HOG49_33540 [Candidatus Scalindua sp.]|jgi:hypothetical protein|nr:hypothetical protein [Candidatus Scalindua sp.]
MKNLIKVALFDLIIIIGIGCQVQAKDRIHPQSVTVGPFYSYTVSYTSFDPTVVETQSSYATIFVDLEDGHYFEGEHILIVRDRLNDTVDLFEFDTIHWDADRGAWIYYKDNVFIGGYNPYYDIVSLLVSDDIVLIFEAAQDEKN